MNDEFLSNLVELIVLLARRIAELNILAAKIGGVKDFITVDENGQSVRYWYVRRTIIGPGEDWFVFNRDEELWDEVVAKISDLNPANVSSKGSEDELIKLMEKCHGDNWQLANINQDASALLITVGNVKTELVDVFLPIWGLVLTVPTFIVGEVLFGQRNAYKKIDEELIQFENNSKVNPLFQIQTVAVVKADGDTEMVKQKAEAKVNKALNMLRVFAYPTVPAKSLTQIGIMGTYYSLQKMQWIVPTGNDINGTSLIGYDYQATGFSRITINEYITEVKLKHHGFNKLSGLLAKGGDKFENRLLHAAEWIGESTKPDTLESKFLKIAFAIDAMIGSESDTIPDKGKRSRIADRATFLLADTFSERQRVHSDINGFVKKRDELAHGSKVRVGEWETEKFGSYARGLLVKLLKNEHSFKTIDELSKWCFEKALE